MSNLTAIAVALEELSATIAPGAGNGRYQGLRQSYVETLLAAAQTFLEGGNQRATVNAAKRAVTTAYYAAAAFGAGGELAGADLSHVNAQVAEESDFIESLWGDLKLQRTIQPGESAQGDLSVPAERIEMFARSLDALVNEMRAQNARNQMLTMDGDDGDESCQDCQRLKGQRHRASWWTSKGLIPGVPGNLNYACKGYNCAHYLVDDEGNQFTV